MKSPAYLLTGWLVISVAGFGLMLLQQSDNPVLFGRYSASYALSLAIVLAGILITACLAIRAWRRPSDNPPLHPTPLPAVRGGAGGGVAHPAAVRGRAWILLTSSPSIWLLSILITGLLVAFWLFMPGARQLPTILLFRLYIVSNGLMLLVGLLRASEAAHWPVSRRIVQWMVALIMAITIIAAGLFLTHVPPTLIFDEAWLANWGYTMFRTGQPQVAIFPDQPAGYAALWSIWLPVQGAWQSLAGISLQSGRLFWLVIAWLSAPFSYLTARRLYGEVAGLIALAITGLVPLYHNYLRSDLFVPLALAIALYLLFGAGDSDKRWRYYAAGFALAFSVEGHVLAVRFALTFGLYFVVDYAWRLWKTRRWQWNLPFWLFVAGGLTCTLLYPFVHTTLWGLPVRELIASGTRYYATDAAFGAGAGTGITKFWTLTQEWFIAYLQQSPLELALLFAGVVFAFWRRTDADKRLLFLLVVSQVFMLVLLPKYNRYYFVHHLPLLALLGGALLAKLPHPAAPAQQSPGVAPDEADGATLPGIVRGGARIQPLLPAHVILIMALMLLMLAQMHVTRVDGQDIDRAIAIGYEADSVLPPGAQRIIGNQYFYWGLHKRRFIALENFIYYVPWEQRLSRLSELAPDGLLLVPGQDDPQTYIFDYMAQHGFALARCFDLDIYQKRVVLYLAPEFTLNTASTDCGG